MTTDAGAAVRKMGHLEDAARRRSHGRWGRGDNHVLYALCNGDGDVCSPLNADPLFLATARAIKDWQDGRRDRGED